MWYALCQFMSVSILHTYSPGQDQSFSVNGVVYKAKIASPRRDGNAVLKLITFGHVNFYRNPRKGYRANTRDIDIFYQYRSNPRFSLTLSSNSANKGFTSFISQCQS